MACFARHYHLRKPIHQNASPGRIPLLPGPSLNANHRSVERYTQQESHHSCWRPTTSSKDGGRRQPEAASAHQDIPADLMPAEPSAAAVVAALVAVVVAVVAAVAAEVVGAAPARSGLLLGSSSTAGAELKHGTSGHGYQKDRPHTRAGRPRHPTTGRTSTDPTPRR